MHYPSIPEQNSFVDAARFINNRSSVIPFFLMNFAGDNSTNASSSCSLVYKFDFCEIVTYIQKDKQKCVSVRLFGFII